MRGDRPGLNRYRGPIDHPFRGAPLSYTQSPTEPHSRPPFTDTAGIIMVKSRNHQTANATMRATGLAR
ncbi:hypothetical protein M2160_003900 [Streptomyces sp. SAI-117]|nr:hypothetical protein [Streptomyces sp. SAI-117]